MTRFLHLADIHLGIRRYRSEERARDFFYAFKDCLERYALRERVDFVLIAGDFFDARRVEPQAMNQAMYGLSRLREAGIPVIVIEGNHDQRETTSRFSWLRSLSEWGYVKLLEPVYDEGVTRYEPWDETRRSGSYIDLGEVRVFGSTWYGATANQMLPILVDALREHRSPTRFNVMMLHTDVEGQINRPIPALTVAKINELKGIADYLALGHTHRNFEIDGWIYNPGSLEACSVDEAGHKRGAYLVEVRDCRHTARLVQDYYQRPILRREFDCTPYQNPEELGVELFNRLRREVAPYDEARAEAPAPVIELSLHGHLQFKSSLLDVNRIRKEIKAEFKPLLSIVRNQTVPVEYAVAAGLAEHVTRGERERRVIEDLISRDARFRDWASGMAGLILEAKRLALGDEPPARIAELIEARILEAARQSSSQAAA